MTLAIYMREETEKNLQRVDAAIARATARHMSNAKWIALLDLLRSAGVTELRWKFVRDPRTFCTTVPRSTQLRDTGLADILPAPYAEFREIEWIEVPAAQRAALELRLPAAKAFPWHESEGGLRVVAYTWSG